jgi:hypothetical protein
MDPLIIPIVAFVIPIIIVPTALGFKHARYLRQMDHEERMKAMELGQTLGEEHSWTPAGTAVTIGAGVPIAAMFIAFIAATKEGDNEALWAATALIGVAGVICGSVLAAMQFSKRERTAPFSTEEKSAFDPDAYDVVGRRG